MYTSTVEKSNKILELYNSGMHLNNIADATKSSCLTVKKVLLVSGIDYAKALQQDRESRLAKALEMYNSGVAQVVIEKQLGFTRKTLRELFKSSSSHYRDKSEQHFLRYGTEIDEDVFDLLTPESLYWLGMIYSDGNINSLNNKRWDYGVNLTLHTDDILHLEKFRSFLKTNRKISKGNGNCSRVRINSKKIHNRLKELWITPAKSCTIKPHPDLKISKDFWRGVIDGDGGVYFYRNRNTKEIFLCGTLETIFDFSIFCSANLGIKEKYPSKCIGKNLYQIHYYSKDAIKIANLLYKDAPVYLERKYLSAMEILAQPDQNDYIN